MSGSPPGGRPPALSPAPPGDAGRALALLADPALATLPTAELLATLVERACVAVGADAGALVATDGARAPSVQASFGDVVGMGAAMEVAMRSARARRGVMHADGGRSLLGCPLLVEGEPVGAVVVSGRGARLDDQLASQLIQLAADRMAPHLAREALDERARRSELGAAHARRHLGLLVRASEVLATSLESYEPALDQLAGVVVPAFADWFAVDLVGMASDGRHPSSRHRLAALGHSDPARIAGLDHLDAQHPGWRDPVRRVIASGRSEMIFDVGDAAMADAPAQADVAAMARHLAIESMMIVPIRVRGLSLGTLEFGTSPPRRGFRPADLAAAENLADRIGVAIERVVLYRETRQAAQTAAAHAAQLRRLMAAALAINEPLSDVEVMRMAAVHARRVIGAGCAVVVLHDDDRDTAPVRVVSPPDEDRDFSFLDDLRFDVGPAYRSSSVPTVTGAPDDLAPGSWAAAPLSAGTGMHGALFLTDRHSGDFTTDDESILMLLAQLVSVSLENARLFHATVTSEERLRTLVDASPLAIVDFGIDGLARRWNPAAAAMFGLDVESGSVPMPLELDDPGRTQLARLVAQAVAGHASVNVEVVSGRSEQSALTLGVTTAPLRDREGRVNGVLGILANMTVRRQLELQVRLAQRMEAMGRLAGGVAHDFNNLLTVILGYCDMLLRDLEDHPRQRDLEAIKQAGLRAAALTNQLLAIGRRQVQQPEVLVPAAAVAELREVLDRMLGETVTLETVSEPDVGRVRVDPSQLEQVILNLVINARDAMPQGGRVLLATGSATLDDERAAQLDLEPGRYVTVTVADTGTGMDAETVAHCFEPFFTTKERGRGTGLGLATVYGIVTSSRGCVQIDSTPGIGTTFTIYLPRVDDPVALEDHVDDGGAPALGRVLLVEDEPEVRALTTDLLELDGYEVLVAADAEEALRLVVEEEEQVDLLLTDVIMPGMSGIEAARRMRDVRPDVKVLFMSGYAEGQHDFGDDIPLLTKPFTNDELLRALREVLGAATDATPSPDGHAAG